MEIPSGWKSYHLKSVTYESRVRAASENSTNLVVFGVSNQTGLSTASKYHADNLDRYKVVKPGMFAYNPMRLNIGSIGYCNDALGEGLVSPDYVVFGCKENKLDSDYFFYCTQEHHWKNWTQRAGAGSVRVRIYYKDISIYPIVLPPLLEQRKIADILSTWDEAIAKTEQLIAALQKRKKGLMQRLLTGEVRFAEFDDEWQKVKLVALTKPGGLMKDGDWIESKDQDPNGEVRLIQLADIGDGSFLDKSSRFLTKERAHELKCTFLKKDDILVARMPDPIGRACVYPGIEQPSITAVDVCIIRVKDGVDKKWLVYAINESQFRNEISRRSVGTTRTRISRKILEKIIIQVPHMDEQRKISSLLEVCDREINLYYQKLAALQQQKKGLMQRLLTGQVRVKV